MPISWRTLAATRNKTQYDFDEEVLTNIRQFDLFNPTPDEFRELFVKAGFREVNIHLKDGTSWICAEGIK